MASHSTPMKPYAPSGSEDWPSLEAIIGNRQDTHCRRQSQVSDVSGFPDSPGPLSSHFTGPSPVNISPNPDSSTASFQYGYPQGSPDLSKIAMFRHHRHSSNASETSSNAPFSDALSNGLSQKRVSASPVPSFEEVSNGGSPYVEEPLPMEGDFASMELRSSAGLNHFLSSEPQVSQDPSNAQRYDTLTWAKAHAFPEPRQETMLATGGLHPKASVSSLTAMLESQRQQQDLSQHQQCDYNHASSSELGASHSPRPVISSPGLTQNNGLSLQNSPFASPVPTEAAFGQHQPYSTCNLPQPPSIMLSPNNPTSPSLRLNMNHPDMPHGPSISLTSATPLTAKPGQGNGSDDFQIVLDNIVNSKESSPIAPQSNVPTSEQRPDSNTLGPMNFSSGSRSFLDPRPPVRGRQRSKSESIAKQNSSSSAAAPIIPFYPGNTLLACSSPSNMSPLNFGTTESESSFPATFWNTFNQANNDSSAPPSSHPSSHYGLLIPWQSERSGPPTSTSLNGAQPQSFLDSFNSKRCVGGSGYDSSFLQPVAHQPTRRSHSVSHAHRRGRSDGGILVEGSVSPVLGPLIDRMLENPGLSPAPQRLSSNDSLFGINLSLGESSGLNMPDPGWISSFPVPGSAYPTSDLKGGSPVGSESGLPPQQSPRARSYSHSSFESEDTAASGLPAEYKSRTTAATKAAAAKRRKEGVAARYVCDMCGETFTRRYNLRGHQRAHKGEKPFECGFPGCTSRFARAHDQKRHYKLHLGVKDYNCKACGKAFIRLDALQRHHKSDAGHACFQKLQSASNLPQDYENNQPILNGIFCSDSQFTDSHQSLPLNQNPPGNHPESYQQLGSDFTMLQFGL